MADHAAEEEDGDIFVYRGGRAPQHVTHVRIDKSVDEIEERAFYNCMQLVQVETHDGIRKVGKKAFFYCRSLPRINLKSVSEICDTAFDDCIHLAHVEFGDKLETIGAGAFFGCPLKHLKLPSVISIGSDAFFHCGLIDIELSERLETIGRGAFRDCMHLRRIAIPLKRDLFVHRTNEYMGYEYDQFDDCDELSSVDLLGGIHKTVASLHMDSWRNEMLADINRNNDALPNPPADYIPSTPSLSDTHDKTTNLRLWMEWLIEKIDLMKALHCKYVKEGISLLELALWKAKLGEKEESPSEGKSKKAKVDAESARKEKRITCGADTVIKNVLPFLELQ